VTPANFVAVAAEKIILNEPAGAKLEQLAK